MQSQKNAAFDTQRDALAALRAQVAYIQTQQEQGYEAVLLNTLGYDKLLTTSGTDRVMILACLFAVILLSTFLFPIEQKKGLYQMVRSTKGGRKFLAVQKLGLALGLSFAVFTLLEGIRIYSIAESYGLPELTAPVHSLIQFVDSPWNLSILATLILSWLARWLVFGAMAVITCLLTQFLNREMALLASSALGIGTAVLSLTGLRVPAVWSVLDGVNQGLITGNWACMVMTIIVLICAYIATVWLWSFGRRAAT